MPSLTGSFLPLELYEIVHHPTALKGFVIALNLAIVIYLIFRLRTDKDSQKSHGHSRATLQGQLRTKIVA